MIRLPRPLGLCSAAVLVATALLAGCSSDDDGQPDADALPSSSSSSFSSSSASAPSETPYLPVPEAVELTEPGSQLGVGDHAVVAYRPRQEQVAALDIEVTRLEKTSIKDFAAWQLSDGQKKSTPYYVHARVENVGETDLGGRPVPLYVVNDRNVLLESTPFASSFQPCPSTPFPERFGPGKKATVCLVYLAPDHGDLVAVSFRPEETFNPITWTGEIQRYEPPHRDKKDHGKGGGKGG